MTEEKTATQEYLDILLLYFEEEIIGEGYFWVWRKDFQIKTNAKK